MARMMKLLSSVAIVCSLGSASLAQTPFGVNIDVDFNFPGEPSTGVPASSYGAAANQPGFWNAVSFGIGPIAVAKIDGSASPVTISRSRSLNALTVDNGSSGEYAKLMGDGDTIDAVPATYTIAGLPAGTYNIYTYCGAAFFSTISTRIIINGNIQNISGAPADFSFLQGGTHARHTVTLGASPLLIEVQRIGLQGSVNGIQIVPVIVSVPTAAITSPLACSIVNGVVEVRGTATTNSLANWTLQYTGGEATTWVTIATSTTQVNNGLLAQWDTRGLRPCGYTLRLRVQDTSGPVLETMRSLVASAQGDTNLDGAVNFLDVNAVLANFNTFGP